MMIISMSMEYKVVCGKICKIISVNLVDTGACPWDTGQVKLKEISRIYAVVKGLYDTVISVLGKGL